MRTARGWIVRALAVSTVLAVACSTSEDDAIPMREIGRMEIGPAGGMLTAGAVTIEIPEGALTSTRTIIVNEADPAARKLPADTQIAGGLYVLQPDDVTFAKPVTVTVQIDESKKRADGKGALVLFRGTSSTAWTPYGATETTARTLVGKTTHFSVWAPTAAAETYCYLNQCSPFDLSRPPPSADAGTADGGEPPKGADPSVLPGLDCQVPKGGAEGVVCTGTAADKGPPYECHCVGAAESLGTWERLPPDTAVTAMAQQCGAPACPEKPTFACDLGLVCEDSSSGGWSCSTAREPRVLCNGGPGGTSCSCTTGKTFTLPNTTKLTNDQLAPAWQLAENCGGSCEGAGTDPNTEWVCPGTLEMPGAGGGCVVETAGTCRDNHVYRAECAAGGATVGDCVCKVDGVVTKTVKSICGEAHFSCSFPRQQGETPSNRQCPRRLQGPLVEGPQPSGCLYQTAGTCRDGHHYRAECAGDPPAASTCTCKVDGVATKDVVVSCNDAPAACGFPPSE